MANQEEEVDAHNVCINVADENEVFGLTSDVTFRLTIAFVFGLVLGIVFTITIHWCQAAIRFLHQKWRERRTTPRLTSQDEEDVEGEEDEIIETTEIFTGVTVSSRQHHSGSSDGEQKSSWAFMNGSPTQEEAVRVLVRRVKELEERESVNSRLLLTLQRKQRQLETSSSPHERRTHQLMEGNIFSSHEMPMIHGLMLRLSCIDQKINAMRNSWKTSESETDGNRRSLIQYTNVPAKDEPRKYIDLRPFFTSSRPSVFTLPYAPLYQHRWNCDE